MRMSSVENVLCQCWNVFRASQIFYLFKFFLEERFLKTKSSPFLGIDFPRHC